MLLENKPIRTGERSFIKGAFRKCISTVVSLHAVGSKPLEETVCLLVLHSLIIANYALTGPCFQQLDQNKCEVKESETPC